MIKKLLKHPSSVILDAQHRGSNEFGLEINTGDPRRYASRMTAWGRILNIWFKIDEKLRFILVGGYNTVCSYLIFFTLNYLFSTQLHYLAILTFSYLISVSNSFFSLRLFVFQSKGNLRAEYLKVNLVYFGYFIINFISLYILKDLLNVEVLVAQLICVIKLSIITYFFHKYFSFKK